MNGWLVIDKPGGMTSRDVVNAAQTWFPRGTKLGHTGTLDPLATGVLVLCVGSATRLANLVQGMGKTYRSRFRLGATSDTDDADGTITERNAARAPSEEAVRTALAAFVGEIHQVPPAYSALKVEGRRSHALARRGDAVPLAPRRVRVYAARLLGYEWPFADVEIECGKGTYIRSIARDLGEDLTVGGLVQTLRRTRVGPFTVEDAISLHAPPEAMRVVSMARAVENLARIALESAEARRFRHGQAIDTATPQQMDAERNVAVFGPAEELIGLGFRDEAGRVRPTIVFAT